MSITIEAIYENGSFKLIQPQQLAEGSPVRLDIDLIDDADDPLDQVIGVVKEGSELGLAEPHASSRGASMEWRDRIVVNPKILVGKPTIRGTRLAVEFILELLAERWTHEQILRSYPHLTEEDIWAVLSYANETIKQERVYPVSV